MYRRVEEAKTELEDPLEALLDLAKAARARLRPFGFFLGYGVLAGVTAVAVLLPMAVVGLLLRGTEPLYVVGLALGALSLAAAVVTYRIDRFLSYFDRRLRAIEEFIRAEPYPSIPEGDDAASRAIAWLERTDDRFRLLLSRSGDRLVRGAQPLGPGSPVFAGQFLRKSMYVPRQYHVLVHVLDKPVRIEDLRPVKDTAERAARTTGVPLDRVLVVQTVPSEIPEVVERWLNANWVRAPRGRRTAGGTAGCAIQVLVEREDGRYEVAPAFAG